MGVKNKVNSINFKAKEMLHQNVLGENLNLARNPIPFNLLTMPSTFRTLEHL